MEFDDLRAKRGGEPSSAVKKRVDAAREVQQKRFEGHTMPCNAQMGAAEVREYCQLDEPCAALMKQAFSSLNMTARSYDRILKVARTIADLDGRCGDYAAPSGRGHSVPQRGYGKKLRGRRRACRSFFC